MGYYPRCMTTLTRTTKRGGRQCLAGSLIGANASCAATEAPKGSLRMVGNHSQSVKAQGSLTVRLTSRAGTKVGLSDPVVPHGRATNGQSYPGSTGLSPPRVHIDGECLAPDVGSSHPGAVVGPKGWAVRPLKRYASCLVNVDSSVPIRRGRRNLRGAALSTRDWVDVPGVSVKLARASPSSYVRMR